MRTLSLALAPAYVATGALAVCGRGMSSVSVDSGWPQATTLIERALTNGQPAFVKARKHVVLSSAQERST
jgi:hypothetical protein